MMALSADSDEKHEPAGDIDTVAVDSLKALDPNRPIREADILCYGWMCGLIRYMALEITSDKNSLSGNPYWQTRQIRGFSFNNIAS